MARDIESWSAQALIRKAAEDGRRWFHGGGIPTWLATESERAGFLLFENEMTKGKMTPHTHPDPDPDESMYVLSGDILTHLDGTGHGIGAVGFAMAPRGVPHTFMLLTEGTPLLCLHTPGSAQGFYLGASQPLTTDTTDPGVVDIDRVQESGRVNGGIDIVGPPPFLPPESSEGASR